MEIATPTPIIMPENIQDWVPENHICIFIVDAVELLERSTLTNTNPLVY